VQSAVVKWLCKMLFCSDADIIFGWIIDKWSY